MRYCAPGLVRTLVIGPAAGISYEAADASKPPNWFPPTVISIASGPSTGTGRR
jgi:hypothetical protein